MKKLAIPGAALLSVALLTGCGGATVSAGSAAPTVASSSAVPTVTQTVTITPKATPTPSTIPTTGSYAADLAALGVVPDSVTSFADWMKKSICEKTGSSLGVSVRSIGSNPTGGGVKGVRLAVAYFCPAKSQEVESYLAYFK